MKWDEYRVKKGEEIRALVSEQPSDRAKAAPRRRGAVITGDEEDLYVFRKGGVQFLDLGTRLRSVPYDDFSRLRVRSKGEVSSPARDDSLYNEYVEVILDFAQDVNNHTLSAGTVTVYNRELLGSRSPGATDTLDPLGKSEANVTGRELPNCMPLPFHSEWLWTDAVLYDVDGSDRYALGADGERPFVDDTFDGALTEDGKWQKTAAAPEDENWNWLNNTDGDGVLAVNASGKRLRVDTGAWYQPLDTGDTALYKWTKEPSFSAAEEVVPTLGGKGTRVFLAPRIQQFSLGYDTWFNNGAVSSLVVPSILTRYPVYPGPDVGELHWVSTLGNGRRNYWVTRGFARAVSASLERSPELIADRTPEENSVMAGVGATSVTARKKGIFVSAYQLSPFARQGQLVGIVEIDGDPYFAWLKANDTSNQRKVNTLGAPIATSFNPQASAPHADWILTPRFLYTGDDDETSAVANTSDVYQEPIL